MSYPPLDPWGNIQRCQKIPSYWRCNLLTGAGECLSEQPEGDEGKQSEIDCISLHIHRHLRLPSRESFFAKQENQRNFRSPPVRLPCAWSDTSWRGTRILWTGFLSPTSSEWTIELFFRLSFVFSAKRLQPSTETDCISCSQLKPKTTSILGEQNVIICDWHYSAMALPCYNLWFEPYVPIIYFFNIE